MKITVSVHPGCSREKLVKQSDGSFQAYLTKRPYKGEANKALIALLANQLDVAKSRIRILRPEKSRKKIIEIK